MIVLPSGTFFGTIGGGNLEQIAISDAVKCLEECQAKHLPYPLCFRTGQCCGGAVEVFIEIQGNQPHLYVFGAGHVGQAVAQVMIGTGFSIKVIDDREEWIESPEIPEEVGRVHQDGLAFIEQGSFDCRRSYAVVMTHDHAKDLELTAALLEKPLRYLGLIGSHTKWQRFQQRLGNLGYLPHDIERIHCPIGLPIGGKAPKEVAISLAAELVKENHACIDRAEVAANSISAEEPILN